MHDYLSSYDRQYEEDRQEKPSFVQWNERVFMPNNSNIEKRIFTPSETVEEAFREWDKRVDRADKKAEWWFKTDFFFVALWPTLLDEMEKIHDKYANKKNLWDNDCYLLALKEVIKNHPEKNLSNREQELTMWLLKILLQKQYDEVKKTIQSEKEKLRWLAPIMWYDYNQNGLNITPAS